MLEAQDPLIGSLLQDRFLLEAQLGSGGMSTVYRAKDLLMDRLVAVKVLQQNSENSAKRFERECRALAAVKCEQVPEIFSWGVASDGLPYLVMELIEGTTLARRMEGGTSIPEPILCSIVVQICDALTAIHGQGIVHRDLKPGNIMLIETETELTVKVMDFGVVHLCEQDSALTGTADIIGSLHYLSPEHLTPRSLDSRSDLFSLGCIMFCMVAGHPPFESEDAMASLRLLQTGERERLPSSVPRYLTSIINKCLKLAPNNRFQSARELRQAILERTDIADQSPTPFRAKSKRTTYVALSAFALVLTLLGGAGMVANRHGTNNAQSTFSSEDLNQLAHKARQKQGKATDERIIINKAFDVISDELHKGNYARAIRASRDLRSELDESDAADLTKAQVLVRTVGHFQSVKKYDQSLLADSDRWVRLAHTTRSSFAKKWIFLALANTCSDAGKGFEADNYFRQALNVPRDQSREQILEDTGILRDWTLSLCFRKSNFDQQVNNLSASTELLIAMTPPAADTISFIRQFSEVLKQIPASERSEKKWIELSNLMLKASEIVTDPNEKIECLTYAGALLATFRKSEARSLLQRAISTAEKQQLWPMYQLAVNTLVDAQCEPSNLRKANLLQNVYSQLAKLKSADSGNLMLASFKTGKAYAEIDNVDEAIKYYQLSLGHAKRCRNRSNQDFGPSTKCPIMLEIADFASLHGRTNIARESVAELEIEDSSKLGIDFQKQLNADLPILQGRIKAGS